MPNFYELNEAIKAAPARCELCGADRGHENDREHGGPAEVLAFLMELFRQHTHAPSVLLARLVDPALSYAKIGKLLNMTPLQVARVVAWMDREHPELMGAYRVHREFEIGQRRRWAGVKHPFKSLEARCKRR